MWWRCWECSEARSTLLPDQSRQDCHSFGTHNVSVGIWCEWSASRNTIAGPQSSVGAQLKHLFYHMSLSILTFGWLKGDRLKETLVHLLCALPRSSRLGALDFFPFLGTPPLLLLIFQAAEDPNALPLGLLNEVRIAWSFVAFEYHCRSGWVGNCLWLYNEALPQGLCQEDQRPCHHFVNRSTEMDDRFHVWYNAAYESRLIDWLMD